MIRNRLAKSLALFFISIWIYFWICLRDLAQIRQLVVDADPFDLVVFNDSVFPGRFSRFSRSCSLPKLDPWDVSIRQYLDPSWTRWKNCTSEMIHVAWFMQDYRDMAGFRNDYKAYINFSAKRDPSTCYVRCLNPHGDDNLEPSEWVVVEVTSDVLPCDVIEVKCIDEFNATYYNYLFSQVVPVKDVQARQNKTDRPNVFVIVLEATSASSFIRSMNKTRNYLLDEFEAVEFKYLNSVGANKASNSRAFMAGKRLLNESETQKQFSSDYDKDDWCDEYQDKDSFIGFDFQKAGYITCQAEETPVYGDNKCKGFKNKPADHYWRPFSLRLEDDPLKTLERNLFNRSCKEPHHHNINYLDKFLYSYPDKSKFIFSWFTEPAHGNINGLFHADEDFYSFFERNKQEMDDSYVFLMSDHGLHYTDIVYTEVGQIELNNPFLMVSLPRKMRGSPTHERLKINSHELVTHFDTHATLVDIVDDYLSQEDIRRLPVHGSSLLKRLPQPRTCNHLNVMHQFCLCQPLLTPVVNSALSIRIGRTLVKHMNQQVDHWFSSSVCETLTLDEDHGVQIEEIHNERVNFFKATFRVLQENLEFSSTVWIDPLDDSKMSIVGLIARRNPTLDAVKCTNYHEAKLYCVCKSNTDSTNGYTDRIKPL